MIRRLGFALGAALITLAVVTSAAAPAGAGRPAIFGGLRSFAAEYTIRPDGKIQVVEHLKAEFLGPNNHGIRRKLTYEVNYPKKDHTKRIFEYSDITVTAQPGYSAKTSISKSNHEIVIKIGDSKQSFGTAKVDYTISYTIAGALNHLADHDELYWNVTGDWTSVNASQVSIAAPAGITAIACKVKNESTEAPLSPCTGKFVINPDGSASAATGLMIHDSMNVVVAFPIGAVSPVPTPILKDSTWDWMGEWGLTARNLIIFAIETIVLVGGVIILLRLIGRDRQSKGGAVDQAFAGTAAPGGDEAVPAFRKGEIPVEFEPPNNLRPAQLGLIIDEQTSSLQISATIVDLATRGYIKIAEVQTAGLIGSHRDWELTLLKAADQNLQPYETTLLFSLFPMGGTVKISEMKYQFAGSSKMVQQHVVDDALERGWFRKDPRSARGMFSMIAFLAVIGCAVVLGFAIALGLWLFLIPVLIAAAVAFFGARYAPSRTAIGTAVYRRASGFKRFITESEKYRAQFAERENIFTEYLAYAVMFKATKKWAKTFKDLGLEPPDTTDWYTASFPLVAFDSFADSLDSFSSSASSSLSTSTGGSGDSGFGDSGGDSGGGGGGGGDGW